MSLFKKAKAHKDHQAQLVQHLRSMGNPSIPNTMIKIMLLAGRQLFFKKKNKHTDFLSLQGARLARMGGNATEADFS